MNKLFDHIDDCGALIVLIASIVFIAFGIDGEIKTMFIASGSWLIKSAFDKHLIQRIMGKNG